jgi:hypothetical protein
LPDARHGLTECQLCDLPDPASAIAVQPTRSPVTNADIDTIVQQVTDAVMAALEKK